MPLTHYRDSEGRRCGLTTLCRREPAWAASELARLRAIEKAAQRMLDKTDWGVDAWKQDSGWYELRCALAGRGSKAERERTNDR